jgi:hypothetical protein
VNERAPADADARERWTHGDPYEQYVGRWSRLVAPAFLSWLRLPPVRCGRIDFVDRARGPFEAL